MNTKSRGKRKAMNQPGHQGVGAVYRRNLIKAWKYTEENQAQPDILIKQLFKLAIQDYHKRRRKSCTMIFTHSLQRRGVKHKQRYRITGLDALVLMPPNNSGLNELSSCIFKV